MKTEGGAGTMDSLGAKRVRFRWRIEKENADDKWKKLKNLQGSAQSGVSQTSTTAADPDAWKISCNSSGQRVEIRTNTLNWLVRAAGKQKFCYEYHLLNYCTWKPTPSPNQHSISPLNIQQRNAL